MIIITKIIIITIIIITVMINIIVIITVIITPICVQIQACLDRNNQRLSSSLQLQKVCKYQQSEKVRDCQRFRSVD